jgi:hypothetical protein
MSAELQTPAAIGGQAVMSLLNLSRSARQATDASVLRFLAVNDTHALTPYRQAALWAGEGGVLALSGVVQIEANAPYVQWLDRVCRHLSASGGEPTRVGAAQVPKDLAADWNAWLPAFGLWLPSVGGAPDHPWGGLLLVRETPWQDAEIALLNEWMGVWGLAWQARTGVTRKPWWQALRQPSRSAGPWWRRRRTLWAAGIAALLLVPVRLTVLAPGELVPAEPTVIRAPLEGVIGGFRVKPNDTVKAGQRLFDFDDAPLKSKLEVAQQALATAEAEYRQAAQLAVSDQKYKGQIALLMGKVEEKRAEAEYMQGQLERSHVVAPHEGIVLFDDPSEWIGKPVNTGERIMRIASPGDVEVEAWLALGDAIPIEEGAPVNLYLNASPLLAVPARVRYVAYEAVPRPDGNYAYRVRAALEGKTDHRVGLKGTAKLSGRWVPVVYWMGRRPLAAVRQLIGW